MINYNRPVLNKDGKPLRILMASQHCCIRVIKQLRALKKVGYQIDGLADRPSYGVEDFDTLSIFKTEKQFKNFLKDNMDKYDIISWANEPDIPVMWIKEVVQDKIPIIVDLHDLDSIRRNMIPIPEREMFNIADGIIYVSQPIETMSNRLHRVTKPSIVLYSYCNEDIIEYDESKIPERKGVIYEGGANPPENTEQNRAFSYRSLYEIIKRLVELGNETYMYCGNSDAFSSYQDTGAILFQPTMYDEMMLGLTNHKYGVLIFNNEDGLKDQVNYTLTNKESEYLHAGLPSLACWCPESEKHVAKHKTGFVFEHMDEIGNTSELESQYLTIMDNIKTKKKELTMENYIVLLENLFAEVLDVEKKGIPKKIQKLHDFEFKN